jgi:cyclopropane fatty-acyl-phospholipid synthase-like methyltransferase
MAFRYKVMYRLGFRPWEGIDPAGIEQIERSLAREGLGDPPYGKALDIGCGTGPHAVRLARLGWQVTGIDVVPQAVRKAREGAAAEGVEARFVAGDVTRMSSLVGDGYRLLVDIGCFTGLDDGQQAAYVREAAAVADADAVLLLFAFESGTKRPLPRGIPQERIEETFAGWKVADSEPAVLPARMGDATARWYRLQRA